MFQKIASFFSGSPMASVGTINGLSTPKSSDSRIAVNPKSASADSPIDWERIKETALQNGNLTANVRVSNTSITALKTGWWTSVKAFFGYKTVPAASESVSLADMKDQLGLYFSEQVSCLIEDAKMDPKSASYGALMVDVTRSFEGITSQLTDSESQTIQEADKAAVESLMALRKKYATPEMAPQVIVNKDGSVKVIKPAPSIENMVLSGGGVKGVGYVGAYKAMEKAGILKALKFIAGSSAGAITASFIACGMTAADFEEASNSISFASLLFGNSSNAQINSILPLAANGFFSGGYAADQINGKIAGSIKKFLATQSDDDLQKLSLNDYAAATRLQENLKSSSYLVTFQDLALLRRSDPSKFKELTVTGFDVTAQKEIYYNATTTPRMCIAEAVRASMSLPLLYESLLMKGDVMEDGGVGNNLPTELTHDPSKTIVLAFDNDGAFDDTVYSRKADDSSKPSFFAGVETAVENAADVLISGNSAKVQDAAHDKEKLYNAGPNALDVYHGPLGTDSFLAFQEEIHAAELQAEVRMDEQLALRQNQATYGVFDDLATAMRSMSDLELHALATTNHDSNIQKAIEAETSQRS